MAFNYVRAQRRPGREPRRHSIEQQARRSRSVRSTKAGARTPATPGPWAGMPPPSMSLNEGRGANPGDTRSVGGDAATFHVAQRRPGREPRRHRSRWMRSHRPAAAQRRPGREPRRHMLRREPPPSRPTTAQRRPGREPRRHHIPSSRSTYLIPAQRRPGREPRRHFDYLETPLGMVDRSTKAGARTPATLRRPCSPRRAARTLNEGRGANPGDTRRHPVLFPAAVRAQRRPGREPRRHLGRDPGLAADPLRSTKAGARTPATRRRPAAGDGDP